MKCFLFSSLSSQLSLAPWMEKLFCQPFMLAARVLRRKSMSSAEKIFCVKAANVVQSTHTHSAFEKTIKFQSHLFPF